MLTDAGRHPGGRRVTRALPIDWLPSALGGCRPGPATRRGLRAQSADHLRSLLRRLANLTKLPAYRVYRPEVFTTDGWGFRNPVPTPPGSARVLLVGDSFAGGARSSDPDTLAARLGARLGAGCNTAPMVIGPSGLKALAAHLRMSSGVVLVQHLGWAVTPEPGTDGAVPHEQPAVTARDRFVRSFSSDLFPLRVLANQAVKPLRNGWLLANPDRDLATVEELANGQPMLLRSVDVAVWGGARPPFDIWAVPRFKDNVADDGWLRDEMATVGLELAVVLVPHKVTVYQPFLRSTVASTRSVDPYLSRLASALADAGITAIDLSSAFYKAAEEGLATDLPMFRPDDSHWNPRGAALAADLVARALEPRAVAGDVAGPRQRRQLRAVRIWRRERDSNPRYPFRYSGFQDRRHQPLGHPSAVFPRITERTTTAGSVTAERVQPLAPRWHSTSSRSACWASALPEPP